MDNIQTLEPARPFGVIPPMKILLSYTEVNTLKNVIKSFLDVAEITKEDDNEDAKNLKKILETIS